MKNKKAPGPNGVPAEVWKLVIPAWGVQRWLEGGHFSFSLEGAQTRTDHQGKRKPVAALCIPTEESCVATLVARRTVGIKQTWHIDATGKRMIADAFSLALEKGEVIILTRKRIPTLRPISIGGLTIESKSAVKSSSFFFFFSLCPVHKRGRLVVIGFAIWLYRIDLGAISRLSNPHPAYQATVA